MKTYWYKAELGETTVSRVAVSKVFPAALRLAPTARTVPKGGPTEFYRETEDEALAALEEIAEREIRNAETELSLLKQRIAVIRKNREAAKRGKS